MYHVGPKDENRRTGFHFLNTYYLKELKTLNVVVVQNVTSNGGGQQHTSDDRTYYYEVFPSNNLELGLWMEAEKNVTSYHQSNRVDTQNEVVKEEKKTKTRVDNQPYGNF
jgi:hypothetical protein